MAWSISLTVSLLTWLLLVTKPNHLETFTQGSVTEINDFLSYNVHRQTGRQTVRQTDRETEPTTTSFLCSVNPFTADPVKALHFAILV